MKTYKFYSDPGHGWLAVKIKELVDLGIVDKISSYSYMRGQTAYLEEDCDAGLFFVAYEKKHGIRPQIEEKFQEHTPIRSYARFSTI